MQMWICRSADRRASDVQISCASVGPRQQRGSRRQTTYAVHITLRLARTTGIIDTSLWGMRAASCGMSISNEEKEWGIS